MENKTDEITIDLGQLAKALWKRIIVIALTTILGGALALTITAYFITPLYEASARLYVNNSTISVSSVSISASDLTASQSLVDTYIVIMESRITVNEVLAQSGADYTYEEFLKMISADAVNDTEIFEVTVTSDDPEEAELLANTIADVLPNQIASIVEGSSVRIVDTAVIPAEPVSPNVTRNTVIGALVGLVVSCAIIIIIELLNDEIRTEEDINRVTALPVLAVIPELTASSKSYGGYYGGYGYGQKPQKKSQSGGKRGQREA
ncbi:MAG: Wzz/FepE/Etk N-terminal domain-containing protein [Oscillospiraceae bacterium]|nr:Wzz/FepE/Etk N-terminal domain-containing protein [Oscillospiraceae bacterium]